MGLLSVEQGPNAVCADFAFYALGLLALLVLAPLEKGSQHWLAVGLCLLAGLVSWTLIEYAVHRWVLHRLPPFQRWHAQHHQHPQAWIALPTLASAALFGLLVYAPARLLAGGAVAALYTAGVLCGYLVYSAIHHLAHHPSHGMPSAHGPLHRLLRRHLHWHQRHHSHGADAGYGVSSPFWDHVFGTAHRVRSAHQGSRPYRRGTWL